MVSNPTFRNRRFSHYSKILSITKILTIQSGYCPLSERAVLVHLLVGRRIEAAAPEGPYSSAASLLAARSAWNTHTKHTRIITYKTNSLKRVNVRESKLEWSTFLLEGPFFLSPPFPVKEYNGVSWNDTCCGTIQETQILRLLLCLLRWYPANICHSTLLHIQTHCVGYRCAVQSMVRGMTASELW